MRTVAAAAIAIAQGEVEHTGMGAIVEVVAPDEP